MMNFVAEAPEELASVLPLLKAVASPENGVQIWSAPLDAASPAEIIELTAALDAGEQARAAQFHFSQDRQRYVVSRALLRHLLGAMLNEAACDLHFECGPYGKPRLAPQTGSRLRFNLSHSAGHAIFALAWNREVGIDLECYARVAMGEGNHLQDLAARLLSERELLLWRAIPNTASRHAAFFRAWTRKEAYVKATGKGLGAGLRSIDVLETGASGEIGWTRAIGRYFLHDLAAPAGFVATLTLEKC
jgi:4'-phosphopantetheinyl transferase